MNVKSISNSFHTIQNNILTETDKKNKFVKNELYEEQRRFLKKETEKKNEVKTTVSKLNQFFEVERTNLKFVFHEELHEYYVTVVNPLTDEIIKEIPPKKILDFHAAMKELIGVLVDEKI